MDNTHNLTYDNLTYDDTEFLNCELNLSFIAIINQILYSIVCIVGLLGNTLVIYVVLRFAKMQTVTNMYIVNLAIADECFLIGIPFLVTTISLRGWIFGNIMCKVYMITTSINQFTSSIFLLIMSADRYVAVCHPISSPKMRTPFISKIISLSAWITSALFMIPIFLYTNTMEYTDGVVSCNIYWPNDHGGHTTFTFYMLIFSFIVPLIFILVFYLLVIKKLRTVGPKNKSKEKKRSHRKVSRLVLTVIVVYVFCWLPYWVTQVALIYTPPKQCQTNISIASFLLAGFLSYSNSAMNPILYAFLSDNFKKSFLKACNCAAGKDINATLNNENSVFPRRKINDDRLQPDQMIAAGSSRMDFDDEETDRGFLSKTSTTTVTMTSRSNIEITVSSDYRDPVQRNKDLNKNGAQLTLLTQV
ncbi:PREDICTED: somatostatin receptor type 2-like [Trachymyrmex cornetzi]|uniref:Somatostatin receptor type 4 n=1 Tax=Trachymyrmex cornetzi TaxID=471704 RepID=A0A151IW31_9HYME|nr:PREDICTED: somatostatin receptor type 2-like [Trachymyrmex cornetzi]KYN12061.1 Somatostatin receptor type 4 [Trachymyrmex cornetzi]